MDPSWVKPYKPEFRRHFEGSSLQSPVFSWNSQPAVNGPKKHLHVPFFQKCGWGQTPKKPSVIFFWSPNGACAASHGIFYSTRPDPKKSVAEPESQLLPRWFLHENPCRREGDCRFDGRKKKRCFWGRRWRCFSGNNQKWGVLGTRLVQGKMLRK